MRNGSMSIPRGVFGGVLPNAISSVSPEVFHTLSGRGSFLVRMPWYPGMLGTPFVWALSIHQHIQPRRTDTTHTTRYSSTQTGRDSDPHERRSCYKFSYHRIPEAHASEGKEESLKLYVSSPHLSSNRRQDRSKKCPRA